MTWHDWFGQPLASSPWPIQVFAMVLIAGFVWGTIWWFITKQAKSTGKSFSEDIWPIISKSPMATVAYRIGIYALAVGAAFAAFGRFA